MKSLHLILLTLCLACTIGVWAQVEVRTEAQVTTSDGEHTPLWLNANKYGLSSLDKTNAYLRVGTFRSVGQDTLRRWKRGFGADMAVATGFTSALVVQQMYGEVAWHHGLLTIGAKQQPMELKNPELSSGPQALGINARPVPGIRIELPEYWTIPGTHGWLAIKGHLFYGWTTDDGWQKDFTSFQSKRTENTMLHSKAGYLRIRKPERPFILELGLEMGCQFGGDTYNPETPEYAHIRNESGLKALLHAFVPGGGETIEDDYKNKAGNHVGSYLLRASYDRNDWAVSFYADHFFEDHSQVFFLDYDGYGSGEDWDKWKRFNWMVYDLRDIFLGMELRLKNCPWVQNIVAEYVYTKYQSGPVYHDHTRTMSDHVAGQDDYYNNYIYTGWQHWGQVMGNPLYLSPLYNADGRICVANNRFWAWHLGLSGTRNNLHYRLLATWQRGFGTYLVPFADPRRNFSLLTEADYTLPLGWSVKGAFALDRGSLMGNNTGVQFTVCKHFNVK